MITKEEKIKLIEECFNNFLAFMAGILGYKDLQISEENHIHKDLANFMQAKNKFKLVLMPRYSFKSTICTAAFSLWNLFRNPNMRILIYSDASTKAEGFLSSIKDHIEGKVKHSEFSNLRRWFSKDKWNLSQIVIAERNTSFPEPSIDTAGIETTKIGMHYDMIIFDDVVSDINTTTKDQMDKTDSCYRKSLSLLKPGGEVVIVGTRWHFGDLYGRIIAENVERGLFTTFVVDGVDDIKYGKYPFAPIGLTREFLEQKKADQGTAIFSCLYRNNPTDEETAVFKARDFKFYGDIKKDDLFITAACDPAGEGEDFTAIVVVGTDSNMDMHIMEIVNAHLQPSDIINEIIRLHYRWGFKIFGLETNFYRGMLSQALNDRIKEERTNPMFKLFSVHEFEASARKGEGKFNRIRALQPYHERGALKFPGKDLALLKGNFYELAMQMIQFPNSKHDDLTDSLAYNLPLVRKGGMIKKQELPYNSPAYLERKSYEEAIEKNLRLPGRFRKEVPQLAFS